MASFSTVAVRSGALWLPRCVLAALRVGWPGAWLAAGLLVLGLAARWRMYLHCPSYWYDEAYLLLNVFTRSCADLLGPLRHDQAAPPLFLLLLRGLYVVGGPAEWVMRLPAFAATLAALALIVPLARLVVGRPGWPWAVGLCAVCHHAVAHGCETKPYTLDLLGSEVALLAAAIVLLPGQSPRSRHLAHAGLLLAALTGPWLSYPSVFTLGAAAAALLLEALRRRDGGMARTGAAVAGLLLASAVALWWVAARHQHTRFLASWWGEFFPDVSSPLHALAWTVGLLVQVGHYGTTGLGVPLLLLAVPGWLALWRRAPALPVLVAGPLALAWVAGLLRAYPLGDRLLLFAAPCLWLPAAAGAGLCVLGCRRLALRGRPGSAAAGWAVLAGAILLPGAIRMAKETVTGPALPQFREAFELIHAHRRDGDRLWVSHPQVYEVYRGRPTWLVGSGRPVAEVERAARTGRLWMVFNPQLPGLTCFPAVFAAIQAQGSRPVQSYKLEGLEVVLYEPRAGHEEAAPAVKAQP
jgi:hypothetical protein